ncbi:type I polyketide synthase [Paenibacillus tengchongensis]|uniref:type I polyketide synthase n=1 Tax=Paenibacillus tengchongensis TaxID=2608684 RepID=UPI00124C400A|nr:type I polyketide synthase [Paenibacillus tengchongensis]
MNAGKTSFFKKFGEPDLNIEKVAIEYARKKDMAIIGASCKIGGTLTLDDFWAKMEQGADCIREFPHDRKEIIDEHLTQLGVKQAEIRYIDAAYMDDIDKFDFSFFNISPKEAELIDPNQRVFLETAWAAIEDAGYSGKRITGSRTGVYVGYSGNFDADYKRFIPLGDTELGALSLAGNIKSIIASRISYLLDLRGPSLLVDTACSSSLVAVHLACQAIRNGECDMALAGGIKINLIPFKSDREDGIGIESVDGRTRSFDDYSDGTGNGEGVIALLIKPLHKAVADQDHIYAVIKGSAINQDGASVGITAPNSSAQEDVIVRAMKDADVSPETISYIEAHGTGTKLGDPVEITGIKNAFEQATDRKQFCAIGSVKTKIGHLDNAAGIAGLVHAMMALKHKKIPPSIHFKKPNRNIKFEISPIYVNDTLKEWLTDGKPRRCGVSSFGLSGTNCHVILEEAPAFETMQPISVPVRVLAISAKSLQSLMGIISKYSTLLHNKKDKLNMDELCYTANTGRAHYSYRTCIVFKHENELREQLDLLTEFGIDNVEINKHTSFGWFKVVNVTGQKAAGEITYDELSKLNKESDQLMKQLRNADSVIYEKLLKDIILLYIKGADVNWDELYSNRHLKKVSLPTYAFEKKQCWVKESRSAKAMSGVIERDGNAPLLDKKVLELMDETVWITRLSVNNHWVLNEHCIEGEFVLPGTAYLEMIAEFCKNKLPNVKVQFKDVIFVSPLVVQPGETNDLYITVRKELTAYYVIISSKSAIDEKWKLHAEAKVIEYAQSEKEPVYDITEIKKVCTEVREVIYEEIQEGSIVTGPRWKSIQTIHMGNDAYLAHVKIPDEFQHEINDYELYPSLLDVAVNFANQSAGEGTYLPFSYKTMKIYRKLPGSFFSYIRKKVVHKETAAFDLTLINEAGKVLIEIEDYIVKKANSEEILLQRNRKNQNQFLEILWKPEIRPERTNESVSGNALLFHDDSGIADKLIPELLQRGVRPISVKYGDSYIQNVEGNYTITGTEEEYLRLLQEVKEKQIKHIIHLSSIREQNAISELKALDQMLNKGVHSIFYLIKALVSNKYNQKIQLSIISNSVNAVTGKEERLHPQHAPLFSIGKVVQSEYPNLICKCMDIDSGTSPADLACELLEIENNYLTAFREGTRFVEELCNLPHDGWLTHPAPRIQDGVFIITGGTGGIGIELAKSLASEGNVKVILVSRTSLQNKNPAISNSLKQMEKLGAEVTHYTADVANFDEMDFVFSDVRARFGRINGIIHCAGVPGVGYLFRKNTANFHEVMSPKIQGTWVLDALSQQDDLDFFVLCSSASTLTAAPGQGDYIAANSFLDAFSFYRNKMGKRTISINWPMWNNTGMAAAFDLTDEGFIQGVSPEEGVDLFRKLLRSNRARVIVGKLKTEVLRKEDTQFVHMNLSAQIGLTLNSNKEALNQNQVVFNKQAVVVRGLETNNESSLEENVAMIWAELLGMKEINIYDSFFDMGGDSIMATRLLKYMNKDFPGMVDISDIFAYPSVSEMSRHLKKQLINKSQSSYDELDDMLDRLASGELLIDDINI